MDERNSAQSQWLDELVECLERNGVCTRSNLKGCDDNEVAKVSRIQGQACNLPRNLIVFALTLQFWLKIIQT